MVNNALELKLPGPEMLAIAYASRVAVAKLRWLLLFDHRLAEVLARAKEPLIAQMRLAWWRDVLAKPADQHPKGEPLLAILPDDPALIDAALDLIDAYEMLVTEADAPQLNRTLVICRAYASWVSADNEMAEKLALAWTGQGDGIMTSTPRALRPLSILALSAQLERGEAPAGPFGPGVRLSWHALTGR
jgi:15-cis-phytoene synthase